MGKLWCWSAVFFPLLLEGRETVPESMVLLKAGVYRPLYKESDQKIRVPPFWMDRYPVTRGDFKKFLESHPEWSRTQAKRIFSDESYLRDWNSDLDPGSIRDLRSPITYVSWFSARSYCQSLGKRLPTLAEWEYAANAFSEKQKISEKILDWYSRPVTKQLGVVGSTFSNDFGVFDLHGLIWEWVEDFNSSLVTGESRGDSSLDRGAFCGAGALNSSNFKDYAAFMRFAFRSSLSGSFAIANLGFRCVLDFKREGL